MLRRRTAPVGRRRSAGAWVALVVGLGGLGAGCGDDHGIPLYRARGQVLIDGKPAQGVEVRLHPADKLNDIDAPRPFALTEADGTFECGTFQPKDGAPVGKYLVIFFWPGEARGPAPPPDRLRGAFTEVAKSPYVATVGEGKNQFEPFQLRLPQARSVSRPTARSGPSPDGPGG